MTALVFIALMAFSVVLAFMAKRGVIADSMDDVMVAGRSFGAFMVFFVTVGETYGIGTMIGVPGAIYSKGISYSLWFLGYILLGFVVGYFMNPAIWRMGKISGAMTMPDCFRWRHGSKALEV
ncbi:MAG: sodium:solute symporter family transporter, partial [Bilophila wadsworthia]